MMGQKAALPYYITHITNTLTGENMSIITTLKEARGDRKALLSLASSETLDQVAAYYNVPPVVAARKVAQRVFDAQAITIKGTHQTYGGKFKRRYDLTDENQACEALRWWGTASESLAAWRACGEDINAYHVAFENNPSLYRHCVQSLSLTRHKKGWEILSIPVQKVQPAS